MLHLCTGTGSGVEGRSQGKEAAATAEDENRDVENGKIQEIKRNHLVESVWGEEERDAACPLASSRSCWVPEEEPAWRRRSRRVSVR